MSASRDALIRWVKDLRAPVGGTIGLTWEADRDKVVAALSMSDQHVSDCPHCHGRGTVVRTYDDYGYADPKDVQCGVCRGSGRVQPAAR